MLAFIFVSLFLFRQHAAALQVTPGSSCAALCLNNPDADALNPASSFTNASDISCSDDDYQSSSKGVQFKNCTECLQQSRFVNAGENDVSWFLYNLRYSVDLCVYGFPNVSKSISSPCDIDYACQPLKKALEADLLDPNVATEFGYCDADGGKFVGSQIDSCIQCFESSTNQAYMANFFTALKAGCKQRPAAGALLGLSGSLFTSFTVNITDPPSNETTTANNTKGTTAMTTGAIVGIAVGATLLFLGGIALFWVYHRKQKRLYADLHSDYDPRGGSKSISPPLHGGFSSMASSTTLHKPSGFSDYELKAQQGYTNNANYYDELEKEIQNRRPNYAFDPNKPGSGPTGSLPAHHAYIYQVGRNSDRSLGQSSDAPAPVKSNKPDSYALQAYLNAAEDAEKLLPGPPPAAHSRGPSPAPSHASSSPPRNSTQQQAYSIPSLSPPPVPRPPKIQIPSVPRIRVPKEYPPPKIHIEGATPVADRGEGGISLPCGLDVSNPTVSHEQRFIEDPRQQVTPSPAGQPGSAGSRGLQESSAGYQRILEQSVVDRRLRRAYEEDLLNTGKSSLMFG